MALVVIATDDFEAKCSVITIHGDITCAAFLFVHFQFEFAFHARSPFNFQHMAYYRFRIRCQVVLEDLLPMDFSCCHLDLASMDSGIGPE